jgi:mRNA-degrading endonuclease toxin of MazEF toxin-antitoxin module
MSLAYPHFVLRRGDVYKIKLPYTEDPTQQEMHPALVLRDERLESAKAPFTIVAFGTSKPKYDKHPFALRIDPDNQSSLKLDSPTFFLAHRLHAVDKDKYFLGALFLGRLDKDLMDRFDELLFTALQITEYKPYPEDNTG